MKKIVLIVLLTIISSIGYAQYYEVLNIEELTSNYSSFYCADDDNILGVIVYGTNCSDQSWYIETNDSVIIDWQYADSVIINNPQEQKLFMLFYRGCDNSIIVDNYRIRFSTAVPNPFDEPIKWKHQNESIILNCYNSDGLWSTGEVSESIEVFETGIYSVTLNNISCGSVTYSVEVRDNVEIYRATTDLVTNLNQVTWNTTPEQSEYITAVKVYRNNELVGTVPYTDGVFIDNIGSSDTQWQYHIVGVSVEGEDCPIPSYWKRTIHLDRVLGAQGQYILQWTPYEEESPEKDEVTAYGIYDVVNGIPNHVIDVGYFTNVYAYNPADFHGYGAVAAVFAEKGLEELAFSNLTKELLTSVGENAIPKMNIYPNPTNNGKFTVECAGNVTIYNTLGQIVARSQATENGIHDFSLGTGIYLVKSDEGAVQKVVVK